MGSNLLADARHEPTGGARFDRGAAVTRSLLGYGMIVGPLYLIVGVAQGLVREGFDFARHSLSVLANGPGGWVQTANFVVCGAMVIAAAIGIARVVGRSGRGTTVALSLYGMSMLGASIFRADPVDGFPVGTPLGFPTSISTAGLMHFVCGTIGFVSLGVSGLLAARLLSRRAERVLARLSLISGLVVLFGFFGGAALGPAGILGIWISVVTGWAWLAVLSRHLYRVSPDPNCAPG